MLSRSLNIPECLILRFLIINLAFRFLNFIKLQCWNGANTNTNFDFSENNVTVMETWRDVTNFETPSQAMSVTLARRYLDRYRWLYRSWFTALPILVTVMVMSMVTVMVMVTFTSSHVTVTSPWQYRYFHFM
jgi:hypothetical protein